MTQPWTFIVPGSPAQRTGGYTYARRIVSALRNTGQSVDLVGLEGRFPEADLVATQVMDNTLRGLPENAVVILDGLAMGGLPDTLAKHAGRLHLVALVHHPLADETGLEQVTRERLFASEKAALSHVEGVITTSRFTVHELARYDVAAGRIQAVEPGVDLFPEAPVWAATELHRPVQLLCVGTLSPRKAQDQLVSALAALRELPWQCTLVGSADRAPDYTRDLQSQIERSDLEDRIVLAGEMDDEELARAFDSADIFILPSLYEGYGMVIDEALARGLPVICSDGGALAQTADRPGIQQYAAGQVAELVSYLQAWIAGRDSLLQARKQVRASRSQLTSWQQAAASFKTAVGELLKPVPDHCVFDGGWLALRESADHRARDVAITSHLSDWLSHRFEQSGRPVEIVDLGSGSGSNCRYLSPRLAVPQRWLLLDQDEALLTHAIEHLPGKAPAVHADYRLVRLTASNLGEVLPSNVDLVTASALIDLVSESWLEALADAVTARQSALLIVLSYAGEFGFNLAHPDDALIQQALNAHQSRDKGLGQALGPEATGTLVALMKTRGAVICEAPSVWQLGPEGNRLQLALLEGYRDAAVEQMPKYADRIWQWFEDRARSIDTGDLLVSVSHRDLLALPGN